MFFSPTPQVRTNLTINTDFAQTEVDQRLTNLTRFPLFFPEKRDFFLDGSTFFDFQSTAQGGNSLLPYFSRRVGLDASGNPQQINIGGKLAGQYGTNDIGAMYVRTGDDEHTGLNGVTQSVLAENFLVLRAKHRMFRQSYVGMRYTGRLSTAPGANLLRTTGADFLLSTSTFKGSEQLSLAGFFLNTSNPLGTGKNDAYGFTIDYPNDPWSAGFFFREIQENYNAAVGFTPRRGFRRFSPVANYTTRPRDSRWIRTIQYGGNVDFIMDTGDLGLLNRDVDLTAINIGTHSGDQVSMHVLPIYEKLETNFTISPGITLPAGSDYNYTRYQFSFSTAQRRVIAFNPLIELGSFYNGTRDRYVANLNVRVRPGVIIYTSGEWNKVDLDQGSFTTTRTGSCRSRSSAPWIAGSTISAHDTQSPLGWQSRFRWILRPGNDFYLAYTHNWQDDPLQNRFYTLDRRAATKFLYTHRF